MFDHIMQHAESDVHKFGISYLHFIFGILMAQNASILSRPESFNGPLSEIRLNPKLFQGRHKVDTPPRKSGANNDSTDDSTSAPPLVPPIAAPSSSTPLDIDMGIVTHLREELCLL